MRRTLSVYLLAAVSFVLLSYAFAHRKARTWTGYITAIPAGVNAQAGTKETAARPAPFSPSERDISTYDLRAGRNLYVLEPQAKAARFAARYVRVTGTRKGDTILATSIVQISSNSGSANRRSS